jgi:hypothetical protein
VFSKFVSSETDPAEVRRQRAINKWLATERENEATNERLLAVDPGYQILPRVPYEEFMSRVSTIIVEIIGEVVPEEVLNGSFSSGASTSRSRTSSHTSGKFTGKADVSNRCFELAVSLLKDSAVWSDFRSPDDYRIVDSNVLFTVPKKTDIDRCACKEPDINMYLQKGAGRYIRSCLRRVGINLNDQTRNQSLARIGSQDGSLATLDLSSASDSISRELVFQALPVLWFSFLNDLRCHSTIIDGEVHVNEMFSSMGNGFTFELESLLFYAIARAVAWSTGISGTISVYGDDIIIPVEMYQDLTFVLQFLGFSVNTEKSFAEGGFRESCGGHYLYGSCVTPFYIRKPIDSLHDLIVTANAVRKWSFTGPGGPHIMDNFLDEEVYPIWQLLASRVPKCFWGGVDLEDSTRLVSFQKPRKAKRLSPISPQRDAGDGGYLFWLHSKELAPESEPFTASTIASFTGRYRSTNVPWDYKVTGQVFLPELMETVTM